MDMNAITTIVSSLGFPIACCCFMGWFIYKQQLMHKEEMTKVQEAINNNTLTMQKLLDKLEGN